ncbi:MAG: inositol monophosphatase family protein [Ilumatobacteraceae bacterium]|nr:histidinol-phosphatase [Actinomycetota bacterium]MDA3012529.1 histidinol-phosphatase [Actinomycetota bacterium]MDA3025434.1 histidinol-phosphatase [Actinomycetota bacterium]NBU56108.1 histidinol-phosphatase [Acidimicrobiia bacterium]
MSSTASLDDLTSELSFALGLADLADSITLPPYQTRAFTLSRKADRSEVTEIDRGCEAAIVERILAERPSHAIFGEEHGKSGTTDSPWTWVVDPIDGTSNFVRGVPVWATLVALVHVDHGPVVGVVSAPALGRRWWSQPGHAYVNGHPIGVSDVSRLSEAQVSITLNEGWDRLGLTDRLVTLQRDAYRSRGYGDFWQHMLVAEGAIDVAVDAIGLQPYDVAAVQAVVEAAGGRLTDRLGTRTFESNSAVSSNGALHDEVVARLC